MKELKRLIKETIDLWIKMRWLKIINKECDKYIKAKQKTERHQYVVNELLKEYKEKYGEELRK